MPLRLPRLEESLCGCSLQAASKIVGWIYLVASISILWILIAMVCLDNMEGVSVILGIDLVEHEICDCYGSGRSGYKTTKASKIVHFASLAFATALIVLAIFNSLLLFGFYNNRISFIHGWIVAMIFGIFIDSITVISTLIVQPFNPFLRLCFLCINIYCLLIVNSYHVNLKQATPAVTLEQGTPAVNLEQGTPAVILEQGRPIVFAEAPSAPPAYKSCT